MLASNEQSNQCVYSVCVGSEPVHDPPCSALNPCKGTLVEPVTNCRRRPLLSSLNASTACQNHRTTLLSLVQCFRRVLVFQSARSIFPSPPMINWRRGKGLRKRGSRNRIFEFYCPMWPKLEKLDHISTLIELFI